MAMAGSFGLLGNGSQADEADEYSGNERAIFRAVTHPGEARSGGPKLIDIATRDEEYLSVPVTAAVGAPGIRRKLVSAWSGAQYQSIVASSASVSPSAEIDDGCIVAPQSALTAGVRLGRHVIINVGATVSHNSIVGDFTTVSPGVNIAGDCTIGDGVFLGIGATISHGRRICDGAVLGAGAVLVEDIDVRGVWVGVPARRLRDTNDWLMAV